MTSLQNTQTRLRTHFYPRPPQGGRPAGLLGQRRHRHISIHVLRKEDDTHASTGHVKRCDFYPRPPQGGRRQQPYKISCSQGISIHVLRKEDDTLQTTMLTSLLTFLSTSSARRTTLSCYCQNHRRRNFYPRPPRGGRPRPNGRRCQHHQISIHVLREEDDF